MIYPNVHILILNWNGKDYLYDCVKSVLNSDYQNFKVTVIDNGSSDNSIDLVRNNLDHVDFIYIDDNLGYSKGYNYAFKELINSSFESEYFLLLNNDTTIKDDTISNLIIGTHTFGHDNIFGPKIINNDNNKIWYGGGVINKFTKLAGHIGLNKEDKTTCLKTMKTDFVSGCSMLIPKKMINNLGGFNELFDFYYEDVDLCLRAKHKGFRCYFISDSIVYHKISSSMGGRYNFLKLWYRFKSTIKYLYLNNNFLFFIILIIINFLLLPFIVISKSIRLLIK